MIEKGDYRSDGNKFWFDGMDQSNRSTCRHESDGHQIGIRVK
jgi:hypothetical protein